MTATQTAAPVDALLARKVSFLENLFADIQDCAKDIDSGGVVEGEIVQARYNLRCLRARFVPDDSEPNDYWTVTALRRFPYHLDKDGNSVSSDMVRMINNRTNAMVLVNDNPQAILAVLSF